MPRFSRAVHWAAVADVTAAQDGLITWRQLQEIGISESAVRHRIRSGGPWTRLLPGVYLVAGGRPDTVQQERASLLYAGTGALLTGWSSLRWERLRSVPARPDFAHVLVPDTRHVASRNFAQIERTWRMPTGCEALPLPRAPIARAALDASRRCTERSQVRALLTEIVQSGLAGPDELLHELRTGQRRGTAIARDVLQAILAGSRSAPEIDLRDLVLGAGLPEPLWNPRLVRMSGAFLAIPDAYWAELGVAAEVDSQEFHFSAADWQRTMRRHARMAAAGLVVLHFPPSRIRRDGRAVVREISEALESMAGRTAPDVVVHPAAA